MLTMFQAIDRLSFLRNRAQTAALGQIDSFQLGVGPNCTERVKVLKSADKYIFPGEWGIDETGAVRLTLCAYAPFSFDMIPLLYQLDDLAA